MSVEQQAGGFVEVPRGRGGFACWPFRAFPSPPERQEAARNKLCAAPSFPTLSRNPGNSRVSGDHRNSRNRRNRMVCNRKDVGRVGVLDAKSINGSGHLPGVPWNFVAVTAVTAGL